MNHEFTFVPALINILIVFFVFRTVMKAYKKNKNVNDKGEITKKDTTVTKDSFERFLDKEIQAGNPILKKPTVNQKPLPTAPPVNNLRYERQITDKDKLQLKRCPNCGGEIPLSMMKCTICGARQAGCGWLFILIALVLGVIVALISSNQGFAQIFSCLGSYCN